MESLEERALLSVTPIEYDALRDANPEIRLSTDRSEINIIELTKPTNAAPTDRLVTLSDAELGDYVPAPNDWVEENYQPTLSTEANDLIGVDAMKADSRFSFADGSGFATVVIDTGINLTHNYFKDDSGASRIVYSYDFTDDNDADATDYDGHGTNVAGIAAGRTGVANDADIIALKVFPDEGGGARGDDILEALRWCVDNAETYNIASVNMSLGSGNYAAHQNGYYTAVIDELADMGVIVCIAAGNDFYKNASALGVASPAATESAVCVSATFDANEGKNRSWASGAKANSTAADQITPFSQRHPYMTTIMAPGAFITSAGIGSDSAQATMTGTSQASPVVAGAAVLAQQIANHYLGRSLTVDEFKAVIRNTGVDICDSDVYNDGAIEDDNVNNNGAWYKRLDVYAMAKAIYGMSQTSLPNFAASESIVVSATSGSASDLAITSTDVAYVATSLTATGSFSGSATATLKLTDAGGVVVKEFAKTVGQAGTFSWNESLGTLAAGEYTLTLTVDSGRTYDERSEIDNVYTKKFAVVNEKPSLVVTTASDVVDDADGQISLREAIAYADLFPTLGGTITFASALKGQTIALNGAELALAQAVTIDASALCDAENGVPGLTLDAGGLSRVFFVTGGTAENPVELIGLKIANGSAPHGGGVMVYAGAAFSAKDCVFVGNQTTNTGGGGICVDGWAALENCVASGNTAATDGGGIYVAASGSLTATETTISGNAATNQGGGLYVRGTATLENATVSGNSADWGGGAIVWGGLTLANSLVVENSATSGGGGFYVGGTATLRNATIAANKAVWGGGLQVGGEGTTTLYNAILATNDGGDVSDGATL
ncbi:MAG: S8 family serine peptidase, partial [Thermoguttaceae bacterium]|nr:S8 family serine peptidase [Thermoguttaceae bacterium]